MITFALLLLTAVLVSAQGNVSFVDPTTNGGSFLSMVSDNLGEPMNVSLVGILPSVY